MNGMNTLKVLGLLSAVIMPFFNIPLILKIRRRRSSADISLVWAVGVWVCVMGLLPASLSSADVVLKTFGIVNAVFFTGVMAVVVAHRPK